MRKIPRIFAAFLEKLNFKSSGIDSRGADVARATSELRDSLKGHPDFSYYSKHLWIWKAIYGPDGCNGIMTITVHSCVMRWSGFLWIRC